jgi:hypothetical protein
MKKQFLHNEIWTLTFGAGFQRANVYTEGCSDKQKSEFKTSLRNFIQNEVYPSYEKGGISDEDHIQNIYTVSKHSEQFGKILRNGRINFGVSQKLLNLYLKYRWCMEYIPTPPHFPVDRRIQENIRYPHITAWTKYTDHEKYMKIINYLRGINTNHKTIADFELDHFERRVKTEKV